MLRALNALPVGVIGRIHGAALGGGAGLAAICDIVVAEEQAIFGFTESKLGILPAMISPFVLAEDRRVGGARAVPHRHALRCRAGPMKSGSSTPSFPPPISMPRWQRYVAELLSAAPSAIAIAKGLIPRVSGRSPEEVAEFTAATIAAQRTSAEGQDGLRAFLEKRSPGWLPQ